MIQTGWTSFLKRTCEYFTGVSLKIYGLEGRSSRRKLSHSPQRGAGTAGHCEEEFEPTENFRHGHVRSRWFVVSKSQVLTKQSRCLLVMSTTRFSETVVPKQSAHFGSLRPASHEVMEMEEHDFLWKQDHIGLRTLVQAGQVTKVTCAGAHMELGWNEEHGCARELVRKFIGQSL